MMYITLKARSQNKKSAFDAFAPLKRFFISVIEDLPVEVENIVASMIADVFEAEGPHDEWDALRPYTRSERVWLGYGPGHPILVREGTYMKALTDVDSPHYVSEYESSGEGSFVQRIGTTHPLFPWHEEGTEHMVARPATHIGAPFVFEMIVETLNEYLKALIEETRDA